jgi:cytochrome c556
MDDQFLHRLRREPPAEFASRLKWQLDRPAPTRRYRSRLILGLAICAAAFALASPPGRRVWQDWFANTNSPANTAPPEKSLPVSSPVRPAQVPGPPGVAARAGQPRYNAAAAPIAAQQPVPEPAALQVLPAPSDAPPIATQVIAPAIVAGVPQTAEMQAAVAVSVRQGLFLNLSFVNLPLNMMLQRRLPLDAGVLRTSATRLQTLSSLIPEVFSKDTRAFAVNTRALESIWTTFPQFVSKADDLTLAADELAAAAAADDEVAALRAIGRIEAACNACHDVYRMK